MFVPPPDRRLDTEHRDYLHAAAITDAAIEAAGIYTAHRPADLGVEGWKCPLPAIVYPVRAADGSEPGVQARPDNPKKGPGGKLKKYEFPPKKKSAYVPFQVLRDGPGCTEVWIVEGTKQALSALSYAPAHVAVYGISGCWGWSQDKQATPMLAAVGNRPVILFFDADAARSRQVFTAAERLGNVLVAQFGATSVAFVHIPAVEGDEKAGLDDLLASIPEDERAGKLTELCDTATEVVAEARPAHDRIPVRLQYDPDRVVTDADLLDMWGKPNYSGIVEAVYAAAPFCWDKGADDTRSGLYVWNGTCYEPGKAELKRLLIRFLGGKATSELIVRIGDWILAVCTERKLYLLRGSELGKFVVNGEMRKVAAFPNGLFDLERDAVYPLTPEYRAPFLFTVDCDFSGEPDYYLQWMSERGFTASELDRFEETVSQMLDMGTKSPKVLLLQGASNRAMINTCG